MRLAMTLLVRNERDIIGCNLDFHLNAGVDHIIITDNASDDGTRDLLSDYDRFSEITVLDEPGDDYSQHKWVTRMALLAADELRADWIINNDADEFWAHPSGDLRSAFTGSPAHIHVCQQLNMVYPHDEEDSSPWYERLVHRANPPQPFRQPTAPLTDPLPAPFYTFALAGKAAVRGDSLVHVHQGNHGADFATPVESVAGEIAIYHYPVRSAAQFEAKIRQGGAAYTRNTEFPIGIGWHWRRWHRMIEEAGVERVMAEALPSRTAIAQGLADGTMLIDTTMVDPLRELMAIDRSPRQRTNPVGA